MTGGLDGMAIWWWLIVPICAILSIRPRAIPSSWDVRPLRAFPAASAQGPSQHCSHAYPAFEREGIEVVHSAEEALAAVADEDVAWVIGGGAVYEQFLPHCIEAEVTRNHVIRDVDTYFPNLDVDSAWSVVDCSEVFRIEEGAGDADVTFEFMTYRRS